MWAGLIDTVGIQTEVVRLTLETELVGDVGLFLLDFRVAEFHDAVTLQTDEVVVVVATIEFKNRLARFEILFLQQAGLFELRQCPIDRGQPDVEPARDQNPIHVIGC